jgi:hypothetical protein
MAGLSNWVKGKNYRLIAPQPLLRYYEILSKYLSCIFWNPNKIYLNLLK